MVHNGKQIYIHNIPALHNGTLAMNTLILFTSYYIANHSKDTNFTESGLFICGHRFKMLPADSDFAKSYRPHLPNLLSMIVTVSQINNGRRLPRTRKNPLPVLGTGIFHRLAESLSLHFEKNSAYMCIHVQTN